MSTIQINDNNTIIMQGKKIIINGIEYKKPGIGNTIVQDNKNLYINGYEFKNGKFKRTLKAIINCLF